MGPAPEPSSKLVVLIVIDQMRADYLTRFADLYHGGLKRFMEKGAIFTEAHHDHGLPGTAAGHATIATGVFPSRHGIPSNKFWDRTEARIRPSTEDTTVSKIRSRVETARLPPRCYRTWARTATANGSGPESPRHGRPGRRIFGIPWVFSPSGSM